MSRTAVSKPMTGTSPLDSGISFCIITDGRRPEKLRNEIESILSLRIPEFEILVGGNPPSGFHHPAVRIKEMGDHARHGRLGALRNGLCRSARHRLLVVADDDLLFRPDFYKGIESYQGEYDVMCVRLLNPDGSRYWDWAATGEEIGNYLLDYDALDRRQYVTGGLCIMKASVVKKVRWDEKLPVGQGEDWEFSRRLHAAGVRIVFNANSTVIHDDARNSQVGRVVARVLDETAGVQLDRFFRAGAERWSLGQRGIMHVPPQPAPSQLTFELQCEREELYPGFPIAIRFFVNETEHEAVVFRQSCERRRILIIIPGGSATAVRLESERFFLPSDRGTSADTRPFTAWLSNIAITPDPRPGEQLSLSVEQQFPDAEPCADGFYAPEPGGRFMSGCGTLTVPEDSLPASVILRISCSKAEHYAQFPFALHLSVDGKELGALLFVTGEQTLIARIALQGRDKDRVIRLESEQSFVPRFQGINLDARRISVLLDVKEIAVNSDQAAKSDRLDVELPVFAEKNRQQREPNLLHRAQERP